MAAVQQGGEENRLSLAQTRLAAEEREALEAIKGDLCQWLGKPDVLALKIDPASFLAVLDSGASLCKLAGLVQEGARASQAGGKKLAVRVPMESLACNTIKAARSSAMFQACARDNTAHFIEWCRMLGVEEAVIFESVGLVEHRDEKRVVLCLLDVARFAEKVGITPPQLVRLEKEIDILEAQLLESTGSEGERTNVGEVSPPEREDAETEDVSRQQSMESEQEVEEEVALDKQGGKSGGVNLVGEEGDNSLQQETREVREKDEAEVREKDEAEVREKDEAEVREKDETEVREKDEAGMREKGEAEVEEGPPAKKLKTGEPGGSGKTSPERPPAHKHSHGRRLPQGRTTQDKSRPLQPPKQAQRLSPRKEETVDEKVMRCMHECTCKHSIQVRNCGKGKFIVQPNPHTERKITLYARLLTDRVMVRVGGGWDTLDHFLLKHDPCRLQNLAAVRTMATDSVKSAPSLGKHGREQ